VTVDEGKAVSKPEPAWNGYRFLGWFSEDGGTEYTVWPYTPDGDVTMHAQWVKQWTVTFNSHGGLPVPAAVTADEGETVPKPGSDPKRAGYKFLGWFSEAKDGTEYTVWPYTLAGDVEIHAQWEADAVPPPVQYTVTFVTHGGSPVPVAVTADEGTAVPKPGSDPKRAGYRFLGWFDKESSGTEYTAWPYTPAGDVTMHAQWVKQYMVTFDGDGGSPVPEAVTRDEGETVPKPGSDPQRAGYKFLGWFDDKGAAYTWDHTLTADVTIHAQWVKQYTVTFDGHGGSPVPEAVTADEGKTVGKPGSDPKMTGYRFLGWFPTASGGTAYAWDHILTADVTLHAQWMPEVTVGVGVIKPDGSILGQDEAIKISEDISKGPPSFTAKVESGYEVVQWYLNGGALGKPKEAEMTIKAEDYAPGSYYLVVSMKKNGVYYSMGINFTVED
jgi:uncharacterized repeat protein (TIGR02543 family)